MGVIRLTKNDPIVRRAMSLSTPHLTEVGMIPGDECGCKIYARNVKGQLMSIIGMHSSSYGCRKKPVTEPVMIVDKFPRRKTEQLAFNFDS